VVTIHEFVNSRFLQKSCRDQEWGWQQRVKKGEGHLRLNTKVLTRAGGKSRKWGSPKHDDAEPNRLKLRWKPNIAVICQQGG